MGLVRRDRTGLFFRTTPSGADSNFLFQRGEFVVHFGLLGLGRIRARAALERAEFGFDFGGGHARGARWREGRVHFPLGGHGVFRGFDLVLHAPEFVERAGAAAHFAEALRSAAGLGLLSARGDRAFAELEFFDFALHV